MKKSKQSQAGSGDARGEIREISHRAAASRQSKKPVEKSNQPRQPKTGGTGGHGKGKPE